MAILILHRGSLAAAPYHEWFADYPGALILLASREKLAAFGEDIGAWSHHYRYAEAVTGYDMSGGLESRALELARQYQVDHIVATNEYDLERAGALREILRLPGQTLESATAFRDKAVMKRYAEAAGVRIAAWAEVHSMMDLVAFEREHGLPLVVKPRNGAGSVGTRTLRMDREFQAYLAGEYRQADGYVPNLIVEAYVPGAMSHIDGLVIGGRRVLAWPTLCLDPLSDFGTTRSLVDVMLDPDDLLAARMLEFCDRVVAALPAPDCFAYHAELFHTPDDELVLCEIASRTGGVTVRDIVRTGFGVDLTEAWLRTQVGLTVPYAITPQPRTVAGSVLLMKQPGIVRQAPAEAPFPWVTKHDTFVDIGQHNAGAGFSADLMASTVVEAPTRRVCEARLDEVRSWLESAYVVDPLTR